VEEEAAVEEEDSNYPVAKPQSALHVDFDDD
jgi:hypothetical protein